MPLLPRHYKTLDGQEWSKLPGKLSASSQPGYFSNSRAGYSQLSKDSNILKALKIGVSIEDSGLDEGIISNLDALHQQGVRVIYNLAKGSEHGDNDDRDPALLKYLWEKKYPDTSYITNIDGVETAIEDGDAPSQEQIKAISNYALSKLNEGKHILIHCGAGIGRTGTILAAIHMQLTGQYQSNQAIAKIKTDYHDQAIESSSQQQCLSSFANTYAKKSKHKNLLENSRNHRPPVGRDRLMTMLIPTTKTASHIYEVNDKIPPPPTAINNIYNNIDKTNKRR